MRLQKKVRLPKSVNIPIPQTALAAAEDALNSHLQSVSDTIVDISSGGSGFGHRSYNRNEQASRFRFPTVTGTLPRSRRTSGRTLPLTLPPFLVSPAASMGSLLTLLREQHTYNLSTFRRSPVSELSGALGDLGTLLPLLLAMSLQGSVSLASTLVFMGIFNIVTGCFFAVPLPVQPMKALAAAAIATHLSRGETMAAGASVALAVLVLAGTGMLRTVTRWIPVPVVKGIQVGAALSLIVAAGQRMLRDLRWTSAWDNYAYAIIAFILLLGTAIAPQAPYALIMTAVGMVVAFLYLLAVGDSQHGLPHLRLWVPHAHVPRWTATAVGHALSQLPLTTLNSIVAVSALSRDLLPDRPQPSVTALGLSVAAMNLVGCWFGAMPSCHGAGGLAAQHRFGARSGASVIALGVVKIVLGLLFGDSLLGLLNHFPHSILGVMVAAAGLELAKVGQSLNHGAHDLWEEAASEGDDGDGNHHHHAHLGSLVERFRRHKELSDEQRAERWMVMIVTAAGTLAFKSDFIGVVAGMLAHGVYKLNAWLKRNVDIEDAVDERGPLLRRGLRN